MINTNTGYYFPEHPRPFFRLLGIRSVNVVRLHLERVIETQHFAQLLDNIDPESLVPIVSGHRVGRLLQHSVGMTL